MAGGCGKLVNFQLERSRRMGI